MKKCDQDCDHSPMKGSWGYIDIYILYYLILYVLYILYIYISELMLHWCKSVIVKQVKIPSLSAIQVAKYIGTVY